MAEDPKPDAPPVPAAQPSRPMSAPEAVVYSVAIIAAAVLGALKPDATLWALGLIAILAGVKVADIVAFKAGRGFGQGPQAVFPLAFAAAAASQAPFPTT